MVKVYCATAMTGRTGKELVAQSAYVKKVLNFYGLEILDPISVEGVKKDDKPLMNAPGVLKKYWKRDKEMIRQAHVVLDVTGPAKSEGVAHEIGYARFFLWKPVVRVYPNLGPSIARFEDDLIVSNLHEAGWMINDLWGTRKKRLTWRLKMLNRCLLRFFYYQFLEMIN